MILWCDDWLVFRQTGFPTHDKDGKILSKNATKSLRKEYDAQKKLYDKYTEGLRVSTSVSDGTESTVNG